MREMLKSLLIVGLVASTLPVMTPVEAQDIREFGFLEMDTAQAREAGISGILLRREGPEEVPAKWVVTAEAFGLKGKLLGLFEIRYPSESREIVSYVLADESATYRVTVDESENLFEFEHVGVEKLALRPQCDPTELIPRGKVGWTPEEMKELKAQITECSKQVEITGTSKTMEEVQAEIQPITGTMAVVASKVRDFFGIAAKKPFAKKSGNAGPVSGSNDMSGAEALQIPSKIIICPPGSTSTCSFPSTTRAFLGEGSCFLCTKSECCTEASTLADIDCVLTTHEGCCANSLCKVTSATGCSIWCNCQVIGYPWYCRFVGC